MHISYLEISQIIKELEEEYEALYKDHKNPDKHRHGFHSMLTLRRLDSRIREHIKNKYNIQ